MANNYAQVAFTIQLASGASVFVDVGAMRDSLSAIVTATPASFWSASPPVAGQTVTGVLAQYLANNIAGP